MQRGCEDNNNITNNNIRSTSPILPLKLSQVLIIDSFMDAGLGSLGGG